VGGPPGPVLTDPPVLDPGVLIQGAQVREANVDQGLDRLPGPPRQQVRGQQPAHAPAAKMHRDLVTSTTGAPLEPRQGQAAARASAGD
jgi:hypothetical protein